MKEVTLEDVVEEGQSDALATKSLWSSEQEES